MSEKRPSGESAYMTVFLSTVTDPKSEISWSRGAGTSGGLVTSSDLTVDE